MFLILAIICLVVAVVVAMVYKNWLIAGVFVVLAIICFVLAGGHVGQNKGNGAPVHAPVIVSINT